MAFTLQSYVTDPTLASADTDLPAFVADPTLTVTGRLSAFVAEPTLASTDTDLPAFVADPTLASVDTDLPAFVTDPTLAPAGRLPAFVSAPAAGLPGIYAVLQTFQMALAGVVGGVGAITVAPQMFTVVAGAESRFPNTMQPFQIVMTGATGVTGAINVTPETLQVAMINWPVGAIGAVMQPFGVALTGSTGGVGAIAITPQLMTVALSGYIQSAGSINISIRPFFVEMTGNTGVGLNYSAVAMHTEWQALTEYTNYPFNSFANFNGAFLGASDTGLYLLSGDTDDGVNIDAAARVGITDFGTSHLKRVNYVYVGYRTAGEMLLRLRTEETHVRDYRMTPNILSGIHAKRVVLGKGITARYWQLEVQNVNGAGFDLNVLEVKPTILSRRISGGRA